MKINNKGFAISSVMYLILVMALIIVAILLSLLSDRKIILDRQKKNIVDKYAAKDIESLSEMDFYYSDNGEIHNYGQEYVVPKTGLYKIELWGAQGGGTAGGKGAYTSGLIELERGTVLYVYVGAQGKANNSVTNLGGFNGGGNSGNNSGANSYGGGGATDVRLTNGEWFNASSLRSRIMVAAGGGGTVSISGNDGGYGGALTGGDANGTWTSSWTYNGQSISGVPTVKGATQTSGGSNNYIDTSRDGKFGVPAYYGTGANSSGWGGGAGGGYYTGANGHGTGGSGGSSFVSGYIGCVNINTNTPIYTGYVFSNPEMKAGNESMPSKTGTGTMTGNTGDGFAKITFISSS